MEKVSIIRVRNLLIVTLPAEPSDSSIADLQQDVLREMERTKASGVVLDLSAAEALDSYFARMIAETAQMIALVGGRTVVAGMQPAVAITATELGLSLGAAKTALNVDRALILIESKRWGEGR